MVKPWFSNFIYLFRVPTDASADVGRAHAVVTSGTGGHARPPLLDAVQLQVEEEARLTGQTAVQRRACCTSYLTAAARRITTCHRFRGRQGIKIHPARMRAVGRSWTGKK